MKKLFYGTVILILFLFVSFSGIAEVRLPAILQSNMVLQQNSDVKIWGWADRGEKIKVYTDWIKDPHITKAGKDGSWIITVETNKAGGPHYIRIKGKNEILLDNILFGEVWVCSGQSNMDFTLKRLGGWDSEFLKHDKEIFLANGYEQIRLFDVANETSDLPKEDCKGAWDMVSLERVEEFSAVAFFFGRELYHKLNVPIGLVVSSWGGTRAEAWTNPAVIEADPKLDFYRYKPDKKYRPQDIPGSLYNAMIHPLLNFKIRGAIWYQGESNRNNALHYRDLFPAMIKNWRSDFNQGIFPFFYVQIAPFRYDEPMVGALLREAQFMTLKTEATGMAVTLDIGNYENIHPINKQDVGKRLALNALSQVYGFEDIEYSGPVFKSKSIEEIPWIEAKRGVRLSFDHTGSGLVIKQREGSGFMVAGEDGIFYNAHAGIEGNSIFVWSGEVLEPVAARYAFTNTPVATLFNGAGLPASSFRTDHLPIITSGVQIHSSSNSQGNKVLFELECSEPDLEIRYTLDGSVPVLSSRLYKKTIPLTRSTIIKARAFQGSVPSEMVSSVEVIFHRATGKIIDFQTEYSSKYPAGGDKALVDGLKGGSTFFDGFWQGYEGNDLSLVIDLGSQNKLSEITVDFIQNIDSRIFLPGWVEFSYSNDGKEFILLTREENNISTKKQGNFMKKFKYYGKSVDAKFIKIHAKNIENCPSWHPGAGEKSWIFADEIVVY